MSFIRRGLPKPLREHVCLLPRWRWLPLLIRPRWREGARWCCGHDIGASMFSGGCGKIYEWRKAFRTCDAEFPDGWAYIGGSVPPPRGAIEPIWITDPETGQLVPNSPPPPPI